MYERTFNSSPRNRFTPQIKNIQNPSENSLLILDLQQKLVLLEAKYSNFVEKSTNLLKSSNQTPSTETFSSFVPEFRKSSNDAFLSKSFNNKLNSEVFNKIKDIEEGSLLRKIMKKVSDLFAFNQEKVFRIIRTSDNRDSVKDI
jgi:hypothetical protein